MMDQKKAYHLFFLTSIVALLCIFLFHYDHFVYDLFTDRDYIRAQNLSGYLAGFGPELSWSGHTFGSFLYAYLYLLNVVLHLSPQVIYIFNFIFFVATLYWLYLMLRKQENEFMAGTACLMLLLNFTVLSELNNIYHPTLALTYLNFCWAFT